MVGPVLYLEMLLGGRRGRQLVFRYLYVGWLVLQFGFLWFLYFTEYTTQRNLAGTPYGMPPDPNVTSRFATGFVETFVVQQLILTLLVTPAFAAGAITDEKTRGTLQHMLTAHLTAGEIVMGKLLARMAQVGLLILAGLPVICFVGVFGGLHPLMMIAVFAVTVAPVFALAAASLLASVWSRQTRDAVLSLYAIGAVLLLLAWAGRRLGAYLLAGLPPGTSPGIMLSALLTMNGAFAFFDPLYVLQPGWDSGNMAQLGRRLIGSLLAWGSVGAACAGLAVWRLRASYIRQLESSGKKPHSGTAVARGPIGEEPIRWKERSVDGIAPVAILRRVPMALAVALILLLTVASSVGLLWSCFGPVPAPPGVTPPTELELVTSLDVRGLIARIDAAQAGNAFLVQALAVMLIASLIVGIRSSGTVSGEREKQTWEALLLTPLETKQLVRGKLWGIFGAALPCLAAYAVPALVLSLLGGFLAFFWTLIWLAVTLLSMWYIGAAGIFCSVRSRSSWRSLLGTLGFGYVGGYFLFFTVGQVAIWPIAIFIFIFLKPANEMYGLGLTSSPGFLGDFFVPFFIGACIALVGMFYGLSWWFIASAEKRVADRERTRHWKDEPVYRPRRRSALASAPVRFNS